jgi:hypothetical protein
MIKRGVASGIGFILALAGAAALSGCDNHKDKSKDGGTSATSWGMKIQLDKDHAAMMGATLPANLPAYAMVYPGADVKGVVTMTEMPQAPWTGVIHYETAAKPDEVLAFYKKNAADAGLNEATEAQIGKMQHFTAKKASGALLSVNIAPHDNGSTFVEEQYK